MKLALKACILYSILIYPFYLFAQVNQAPPANIQAVLHGTIIDSATKAPVSGATIQIIGTTHSVISNSLGKFEFVTGQKLPFELKISSVGYKTIQIEVTKDHVVIPISENQNNLNDVVVVGYGSQKKSDVTGSIATVPTENFSRPSTSFDNLLQGAVAGVQVSQSSSQPGSTSTVRIRGGNSLSFGNDPLYVIDGFIYYNDNNLTNLAPPSGTSVTGATSNALSTINPNDIESIDILKDASATAIYGSRGANGVVIITTKRGVRGSNNVEYSGYYGWGNVAKQVGVLNGPQWAKYFDDLYNNTPSIQGALASNKHIIDSLGAAGVNNDWANAALRTSRVQNHELSIYGGDDKSKYAISGNYFHQIGGVLNTDFTRYSARFNYERNVSTKLKVTTSIYGSNSVENKLTGSSYNAINSSNSYSALYSVVPLQNIYNADGTYNTTYQPAVSSTSNTINGQLFSDNQILDIASTKNQSNITRVLGNIAGEYKILKELTFKTTFGADIISTKLNYYAPSYTSAGNGSGSTTGYGSVGNISYLSWLNENTLTYTHTFSNNHFLDVLAGYTTQYQHAENSFAAAASFPSDYTSYEYLYSGSARQVTGSGESQTVFNSWLGRINYSYKHLYNLTLSGRADGASAAGANHKWGFFPAVGVSWNASQESFFDKFKNVVSNLKLRFSTGTIGNANFPAFSSLATINTSGYYFGSPISAVNGLSQSQLSNPDLTWESTTQYDLGLDAGFVQNRINLTADVYLKKTTHLFVNTSGLIPLSTGYASAAENIGSIQNKGLELTLTTVNIKSKDFSWKSTILYATNINKILNLGPSSSFQPIAQTGQVSPVIVKVGLPVGTFWGYKTDGLLTSADVSGSNPAPLLTGVSQQVGDRKYLHAPGITGATITTADKQNLGSAQPKFTGSFSNTVTYKNFDLSIFLQGTYGNKIFDLQQQNLDKTTTTGNVSADLLNRYDAVSNPKGTFPKIVNAPVMQMEDTYIHNGSYLRLQNVSLGYILPATAASKLLAKQIRIYFSAQNLFTITKYPGLNPEANFFDQNNLQPGIDLGIYPNFRTYQAGVDVTF
ncbi:MAG: TonB-dependent receptor [Arachidicoccus sp.]|nr:TonB-dependent receptor [Arachidicoccus sp.]